MAKPNMFVLLFFMILSLLFISLAESRFTSPGKNNWLSHTQYHLYAIHKDCNNILLGKLRNVFKPT